uniref:NADH-ubiquinone oxidoreductase chain 2 n=1 Tax=Trioza anthrisci TaxID=2023874 RepID=A0A344A2S3_9HEMI|nr:NADH dehydrogenase subunit 2 [Trioza anthrisci]AWU49064.1 NADH dehydrogenase subunit 2 [Trioza anthrisci]
MYMYNFIIFPLYFLSIIFSLSSSSWILIWMGMEINLLVFIFIVLKHPVSMMKTESSMKYFLIQSMGSLIFLLTINSSMIFYNEKSMLTALVPPLALMLKSGIAPMHSWTPPIVSKFPPSSFFLFLTFQKLVPIFIMFSSWFWIVPPISLLNILVGSLGGISQSSLTKMVIFSSINNIGWMMLSMMNSFFLFNIFFLNYMMLSYLMIKFIHTLQIKWIIQIKSYKASIKWFYFSIVMSMSGYPPFMGFTPKWLVMKYLYLYNPILITVSIMMSAYALFFYIKSSISMITNTMYMKKWYLESKFKINLMFIINFMGPVLFYLIN